MKVRGHGTVEERLRDLERAINFGELLLPITICGGDDLVPVASGTSTLTPNVQQALTGSFPGTGPFALPSTPAAGMETIYYRGERLKRVASSPGIGEYTIATANVTTGFTVGAVADLWSDYFTSGASTLGPQIQVSFSGSVPGTGPFTAAVTPAAGKEAVYHRDLRLKRVAVSPGIGEYTISGAVVTTGFTVQALADLWCDLFS